MLTCLSQLIIVAKTDEAQWNPRSIQAQSSTLVSISISIKVSSGLVAVKESRYAVLCTLYRSIIDVQHL
jgi:hypothetical protein